MGALYIPRTHSSSAYLNKFRLKSKTRNERKRNKKKKKKRKKENKSTLTIQKIKFTYQILKSNSVVCGEIIDSVTSLCESNYLCLFVWPENTRSLGDKKYYV